MSTWGVVGVAALAGVAWGWSWLKRARRFAQAAAPERAPEERSCGFFETVHFPACDGTDLEGWLFRPRRERAPLVIMAPGLTGTKQGFYERFAWAFVERGVAALIIDYRCFGGSGGAPRHWVDPQRHLADYASALAFARSDLPQIDGTQIALWGSSFSGGVALAAAAADGGVRALIAQAPFLETPPSQVPTRGAMARYYVATFLDLAGLGPIYLPALGRPGEFAFAKSLENPSVRDFGGPLGAPFWRALPQAMRGGWENKFLARMLADFDRFQPMRELLKLTCPVLWVAAEHDDMVPLASVRRAQRILARADSPLLELPCGHFDLYFSELAEGNAQAQASFLADIFAGAQQAPVAAARTHALI